MSLKVQPIWVTITTIIQGSVEHDQCVVKDGRGDCPLLVRDWCPATVEGYPSPFEDSCRFGREQVSEGLPELQSVADW